MSLQSSAGDECVLLQLSVSLASCRPALQEALILSMCHSHGEEAYSLSAWSPNTIASSGYQLFFFKFRSPSWMCYNKYLLGFLIFIFLIANVELLFMRILDLCVSLFVISL